MNERELGDALLRWDAAAGGLPDPKLTAARVLDRDGRRVRWLAAVTTGLWVLVAVGLLAVVYGYTTYWHPKVMLHIRLGYPPPSTIPDAWDQIITTVAAWLTGVFLLVLLAAVSTVLYVTHSRRATVRHVNAGLIEMTEQVRQLRRLPEPGAAGGVSPPQP